MTNVELRRGKWFTGSRHSRRQACVKDVDIDVNPASPYKPKRPLKAIEQKQPQPRRRTGGQTPN